MPVVPGIHALQRLVILISIFAAAAHANDVSIFVKKVIDHGRGNEEGTCFFRFTGQPAIKRGA